MRNSECEIERKLILIRAVTFVMYGSELVHFAWSHHGILPGAKTRADQNFQNSASSFQNLRKQGMDSMPLAIMAIHR